MKKTIGIDISKESYQGIYCITDTENLYRGYTDTEYPYTNFARFW